MNNQVLTYCGTCYGDKHHVKLFSKKVKGPLKSDEEYAVVQCLGCKTVSFLQIVKSNRKSAKPKHYNYPNDDDDFYLFLPNDNVDLLPKSIAQLYEELVVAFDSDSPILAGIGLRALVESVCIDQKIQGKNLQIKIQGLNNKGLISTAELPILDKLRLIGNSSAHESKSLPMRKLESALGIINHVLISIYLLPKINKKLKVK